MTRLLSGVVGVLFAAFIGNLGAEVTVLQSGNSWSIENRELRVSVSPGSGHINVLEKSSHHEWTQGPAQPVQAGPRFQHVRPVGEPANGIGFELGWGKGATNLLTLTLTLREEGADLFVRADLADHHAPIENLACLEPFALDSTNGALVVADYCNGHLYPLELQPFPRTWFSLPQIDMPWVGVVDLEKGFGYALMVETPDEAFIRLQPVQRAGAAPLAPQVGWTASHKEFGYVRRYFYHFSAGGGYVALAKRYRQYARELGVLVPFAEKLKRNPNISRIFGAPDVWGNSSLNFAQAAKAAGVEKMIMHGQASPEEMKAINDLGYLTSTYDNYTDIFQVEPGKEIDSTHGRLPEDVVLKADGERMKAWLTWDKKQYLKRCPALWLPAAKIVVPKALARFPYLGRFVDVTTAEDLYECFDPAHPLTRTQKRQCGAELLGYVRSLGLVTGGEHGRWWAVPQLDYIEGMMSSPAYSWPAGHLLRPKSKDQEFTSPWGNKLVKWEAYEKWGIGHQYRVPLWELVFHDCIVSTWYWGDSSDFLLTAAPEVTPKKDAFNVLYGTIPILWANREGSWSTAREVFLRTYRNTCKLHEAIAGTEMLDHEFLTVDRAVQRTHFSDGTQVVVNFGQEPYAAHVGGETCLLPQNGFVARGPRIQQSLALVEGRRVVSIQTGDYHFTETLK